MSRRQPGQLEWLRLRWALWRLTWRIRGTADHWHALEHDVPLAYFGEGAEREFEWYLEGDSDVRVDSVNALCEWLEACDYVRDPELFRTRDFWQHPSTFEQVRQGDCEDHALWAWRKLVELGHEAEFVVGRWHAGVSRGRGWHSWVVYSDPSGARSVLEATCKRGVTMVRPLEEVRDLYVPCFSVDHRLVRRVYAGWISTIAEERSRRE